MGEIILGAAREKSGRNADAVRVGQIIFTSGTPINWDTGEIVGNTVQNKQSKPGQ